MKIGVLGAGLMGKEIARDLLRSGQVKQLGLADLDWQQVQAICQEFQSPLLTGYQVDANQDDELREFMKKFDVIINALFYSFNKQVARLAVELGVHSVDLGGHIGNVTKEIFQLHEAAQAKQVTIIPDLGVAPGMINILSGYAARKLDRLQSLKMYVGGIPLRPEAPLGYHQVFSLDGVFDHYTDPSLVLRNGQLYEVPSLSEVEDIYFTQFGPLEAFHTSGGTSTLLESFPEAEHIQYKTIRYPGHAEKFQLLVDLQLTRRDFYVEIDGKEISPREVLLALLNPIVALKDKEDVVLLRVIAVGWKAGKERRIEYELVQHYDQKNKITAMALVTASTISIVAQMIAAGKISERGVFAPEILVDGKEFIEQLKQRKIIIEESIIDER